MQTTTYNNRGLCPHTEKPSRECFCFDLMKSSMVKLAIQYCGGGYQDCDIFQKLQSRPPEGPDDMTS